MAQTVVDIDTREVWPEGAEELGISRSITMAERNEIDDSDFAWPDAPDHPEYPINTQAHLDAAAKLIGRAPADKQAEIKARAKRIAKRKGFKLPDSWANEDDGDEGDSKDRAMGGLIASPAASSDGKHHESHTGTHSHRHDHVIDGYSHEHPHDHTNDNLHDHGHAHAHHRAAEGMHADGHTHTPEERATYAHTEVPLDSNQEQERATSTPIQSSDRQHVMSLPLVRIDATKREVWGQATAEVPDSYGTIFGFYPEAWTKWRGNIREQHDPKKAVGKAVDINPDPNERAIYVGSRVSRGAQDTWLKVEDNVLTGYSASIIPDPEFGNNPAKWPKKLYNGKEYPYLPRYTVAELSLVDNPACPGCNIQIVRADGFATDVLDVTEEEPLEQKQETQDRAGARVGTATKSKMHESIGHTLQAAKSQMQNCDCPTCQAAIKVLDPDDDGDIDLGGYDDPDNDWQSLYNGNTADMERVVTELIERSLQPVYTRLQGIAGTLARSNATSTPMHIEQIVTSTITRAFETFESRMAELPSKSSFDEVRAELSAVKGQVDKIAEQPMPGGPVLNASVMPRPPIEKSLATDFAPRDDDARSYGAVYQAIAEMSRRGGLDTPDKQVDAMAAALAAQRRG